MFPLDGVVRLAARVGDLPIQPIPVVPAHLSMAAARKVAALKRVALLLVESDEVLLGIIDELALAAATDATPIAAAATPLGACLRPSMSIAEAREMLNRTQASALPLVAGGFVLGAVARRDVEEGSLGLTNEG